VITAPTSVRTTISPVRTTTATAILIWNKAQACLERFRAGLMKPFRASLIIARYHDAARSKDSASDWRGVSDEL